MFRSVLSFLRLNRNPKTVTLHILEEYSEIIEQKTVPDTHLIYKGQFSWKYDFLIIYFIGTIGMRNFLHFPTLSYLYGGATFILAYFFLSLVVAIPIFLIEFGLSQFYSVGESRLFFIVPYFGGLGLSIHILNLISIIPECYIITWLMYYLLYSLQSPPPWSLCNLVVPGIQCVEITNNSFENHSKTVMNPSVMFFDFVVKGSRELSNGSPYSFYTSLYGVRWFIFLLIIVIWVLIAIYTWSMVHMYTMVAYFSFFISISILLILTIKASLLPGSFSGLVLFFSPNLNKLMTLTSLRMGVVQIIFSVAITKSMATFASLNSFDFNFLRASYFIIFGDIFVGIISGIFVFSNLGFLSLKLSIDVDVLMEENNLFVNVLNSAVINSEMRLWVFLLFFILLILSISSLAIPIASMTISFIDFRPNFMNYLQYKKTLICFSICGFCCFMSFFFSLNGSILYHKIFTKEVDNFTTPVLMLGEIIIINFIYGEKRLRLEVKMMIGHSYNVIWRYFAFFLTPVLLIFVIAHSIYSDVILETPIWAKLLSKIISWYSYLPLIVYFILELKKNNESEIGLHEVILGLKTPEICGPYFKKNWLASKYYQRKLILNRKNPEFLKTIRENENLENILDSLKEIRRLRKNNELRWKGKSVL